MAAKEEHRHQLFVDSFMLSFNGKEAAIRAGYAEDSAAVTASRLLKDERVQLLISEKVKESEELSDLQRIDILHRLYAIVRATPFDFLYQNGGTYVLKDLQGIDQLTLQTLQDVVVLKDGTIKVTLSNKMKALELLGKYLGMFDERIKIELPTTPKPAETPTIIINHRG
jgi:phage terminase small subunit